MGAAKSAGTLSKRAMVPVPDGAGGFMEAMATVSLDPATGDPAAGGGGGGGTDGAPNVVRQAQGAPTHAKVTLAAGTPVTVVAASSSVRGARILNWTASPVYVAPGESGTPASGAPSDYIPAASGGAPGQYEPPYAPTGGLRAVGASAGDLTIESW